jgi:hypothetical protein
MKNVPDRLIVHDWKRSSELRPISTENSQTEKYTEKRRMKI